MIRRAAYFGRTIRRQVRNLILGPQLLGFLPALMLAGFWVGGEPVLIGFAILMPLAFWVGGLYTIAPDAGSGHTDPETGLPLRAAIVARTDALLKDGPTRLGTTASLAIAVDEFAELTNRYGADTAAAILGTCGDRLRAAVRDTDLLGRLPGPGFVIVTASGSRFDLESLIQLSSRLQKELHEPILIDGSRVYVSMSVGFCTPKRRPEPTAEALVGAAEQALDDAMSNGTGAIRAFTLDMQKRARTRGALSDELPRALEENRIRPWFQPQISTETGEVTGFEVLARWEHPTIGLIPPAEFLPAAENLGLLGRLGEVMLYQSLNALRAWDADRVPVPNLSLNFSAEELRDPTIVEKIRWELDRFDIAPERLTIEILETVIAQTANDTIIRSIRAFADMGCRIDLDDFGTGHASIANIKRFSVGRIKIDRSFVTRLDTDAEQQNIVSAILTLAERLDLDTLAEGVENASEQAILRQLGCGHVQGFAIARPMPFGDVSGWLDKYARRRTHGAAASIALAPEQAAGAAAGQGKTA